VREFLLGLTLGLSAGISPGPLLALVIGTTLRHSQRAGIQVAMSPLITDLPIIVLALTVVGTISSRATAMLGAAGALVILKIAVDTLRGARRGEPPSGTATGRAGRALRQGVLVNLLSPHPWLFWLGVGAPLLVTAGRQGGWYAGAFLAGFYTLLVGSKVALAFLLGSARHRIGRRGYRLLVGGSGLLLVAAAVGLAVEFVPVALG
jgi:threonine/homoserine/homoserine lactone efflux protein